jgi:copper(I)-binding protein
MLARSCRVAARVIAAALMLGTASISLADSPKLAVSVTNARIRLLPGDLPLAGYFDLHNDGKQTVTLTGASSPAFHMVHLHLSEEKNGTSTMVMVEGIEIKSGATLHVAPGGYHLMLMQRTRPLHAGDRVPITLKFRDGQTTRTMFDVREAGGE